MSPQVSSILFTGHIYLVACVEWYIYQLLSSLRKFKKIKMLSLICFNWTVEEDMSAVINLLFLKLHLPVYEEILVLKPQEMILLIMKRPEQKP